jgi:hypothetical protein
MNEVADGLYHHHAQLTAVLAVAALALLGAVALGVRQRSLSIGFGFAVAPSVVIAAVIGGWAFGDAWSNSRQIDRRVREVTATFPNAAQRVAVRTGDNSRSESYVLSRLDHAAGGDQVRRSLLAALSRNRPWQRCPGLPAEGECLDNGEAAVYLDQWPQGLLIAFPGGRGCDGIIGVDLKLASGSDGAAIDVVGFCED